MLSKLENKRGFKNRVKFFSWMLEHRLIGGSTPPALEERGQGNQNALLVLSTDIIFSHFLLTFVLLSGSTLGLNSDIIIVS